MYTILVGLGVGIVAGAIWTVLGLWKTWAFGIVLGLIVSVTTFAIVSRRTAKRVEPIFEQIQRQVQGGNPKLALRTLQDAGQLRVQIATVVGRVGPLVAPRTREAGSVARPVHGVGLAGLFLL